jgi:hypothetical protein
MVMIIADQKATRQQTLSLSHAAALGVTRQLLRWLPRRKSAYIRQRLSGDNFWACFFLPVVAFLLHIAGKTKRLYVLRQRRTGPCIEPGNIVLSDTA